MEDTHITLGKFPQGSKDTLRVNEQIKIKEVQVIGEDGSNLGVLQIRDAIEAAMNAGLDLVEVAPTVRPPVCKIMDFGKYKYRQSKKAHENKRKQKVVKVKEIKISLKTEEHDYQFKLAHIKRFLNDGDKAKITVVFKGREIAHADLGLKLLERFIVDGDEFGEVEQFPKQEGRFMTIVLRPKIMKKLEHAPPPQPPMI